VVALLTISKGLTLAYNKDLQETQEPFYDALETARASLAVLPRLVMDLEFDVQRMRDAAADPALGATDLAEELVRRGTPFRRAHEIVGTLVRHAEGKGVTLRQIPAAEMPAIAPELAPDQRGDVLDALDPRRAVEARTIIGGPAPSQVLKEVERLEGELRGLGFEL
jgi:argininosuccinate lyase